MSEILEERGYEGLDTQWTVLNTGSADNVPTFVSLFGANDLDIAVLLDGDGKFESRKSRIEETGTIEGEHITATTDFIEEDYGDIEDLFSQEFYLNLVNGAYQRELLLDGTLPDEITGDDLYPQNENPRVVTHLERYFEENEIASGRFRHTAPAEYLQEDKQEIVHEVDESSLENFESLFTKFNSILADFE